MKIRNNYSVRHNPYFGLKVPIRTALEAASGRFFDEGKIAHPRQLNLLAKLGNLEPLKLYSGEVSEAMRGMRNGIKKQHPEIALAAERINKECDSFDRTFLPEDEIKFKHFFTSVINKEIKLLGKNEVDIAPFSLKELGLDKYENL